MNNNWTNEDPKGNILLKEEKKKQKHLVHSKYSTKCLSRKKQGSQKNKNVQNLTSVDLHSLPPPKKRNGEGSS